MGYLPEAMRNYLARLGWAHGDDEFFTTEQAVEWFTLDAIGKSAARFDFQKLENLNGQHMRAASDDAADRSLRRSFRNAAWRRDGRRPGARRCSARCPV